MLNDKELDELIQPIIDIYNEMELELFKEIAERITSHNGVAGDIQWYLDKVNDIGKLNDEVIKIIAKYSTLSEKTIREILKKAQFSIFNKVELDEAYQKNIIPITAETLMKNEIFKSILFDSYNETGDVFKMIQTKALESSQQMYMDVLNKAYIETSSGTYSYTSSIKKALLEMAKKGITGATYKRKDGSIVNYSIEATVRRDILTATNSLCNTSEMKKTELLDAEYVEVSSHIGARVSKDDPIADHAGWQGKVYKLEGKTEEYDNFYESTGYGEILGLGGVNCRHHFTAFFPGFSKPVSIEYDYEENKKYYEATQKQRKLERDIRKLKKEKIVFEKLDDAISIVEINKKIISKSKELNKLCNENGLRRDRTREKIV